MLKTLVTGFVLLVAGTTAFAAPAVSGVHKAKAAALICPVTGEKIASIKEAAGSSTYHGKTYYFCCPSCKPTFDKNPAKYSKSAKGLNPAEAALHKM